MFLAVFSGPHLWYLFCEQYKSNPHYEIPFNIILLYFDVFLTVHHSIDVSKYQVSAQFF